MVSPPAHQGRLQMVQLVLMGLGSGPSLLKASGFVESWAAPWELD